MYNTFCVEMFTFSFLHPSSPILVLWLLASTPWPYSKCKELGLLWKILEDPSNQREQRQKYFHNGNKLLAMPGYTSNKLFPLVLSMIIDAGQQLSVINSCHHLRNYLLVTDWPVCRTQPSGRISPDITSMNLTIRFQDVSRCGKWPALWSRTVSGGSPSQGSEELHPFVRNHM